MHCTTFASRIVYIINSKVIHTASQLVHMYSVDFLVNMEDNRCLAESAALLTLCDSLDIAAGAVDLSVLECSCTTMCGCSSSDTQWIVNNITICTIN